MNSSDKREEAGPHKPSHESRSGATTPTEKSAFTVREAAQRIGCSTDTIYRMVKSGELPALRNGPRGKIFIAADQIERLFRGAAPRSQSRRSHLQHVGRSYRSDAYIDLASLKDESVPNACSPIRCPPRR